MSVNYFVKLAASVPTDVILERIAPSLPQPLPRPEPYRDHLGFDFNNHLGFGLDLSAPRENDYIGGLSDDGEWSWELPLATSIAFQAARDYDGEPSVAENVLKVVAQILATGDEDLSFTFEYDLLYLFRQDGEVIKNFRDEFWNHYPLANQLIPD